MLTIAIAADNAAEMEGLKSEVVKLGHQVVFTATNGYDLLKQLSKLLLPKLPKVILLDVKMPKINGLIVTIYCAYKYPSIKIIAVSSYTNGTLIVEMFTEGASAFITKYFLTPNSVAYKNVYGAANALQLAIEALQKGQLFIDRLLVNNPNDIKKTVPTSAIIDKYYNFFKPKHREFVILNASGLKLAEIALLMNTTVNTLKDYNTIFCKLFNVNNHHQVAQVCVQNGIVKQALYFNNA
ncbi:MAG: response regulator [Flavobacterium sp.]|nr:response regulator [Flavobacterium sp.]